MNRAERQRLLGPLQARMQMMVARVVLTLVNDDKGVQSVQADGLADEVIEDAERFQSYGFTSAPHPGAEGVMVFPGGLRSHGLVIGVEDRRYRLKALKAGEVAMYDDLGQSIILTRDGIRIQTAKSVEIEAGEALRLTAQTITATADTFRVEAATQELVGDVVVGGEAGGGKAIARHDDPVVAGKVVASAVKARAL